MLPAQALCLARSWSQNLRMLPVLWWGYPMDDASSADGRRRAGPKRLATSNNGNAWKHLLGICKEEKKRTDNEDMFWKPTPLLLVVLHILP